MKQDYSLNNSYCEGNEERYNCNLLLKCYVLTKGRGWETGQVVRLREFVLGSKQAVHIPEK